MSLSAEAPALIGTSGDSLREAFGKALSGLADEFPKLVVLDADIAGGTGVHHFRKSHPARFLQFGIAEQNMMAAAGGLAAVGLLPVVTTFAVFCLGFAFGAEGDILAFLVARHFGVGIYSSTLGLLTAAASFSTASGAALLSLTMARTGGFDLYLVIVAICSLVGAASILMLGKYRPPPAAMAS